jgi:flagellar motor switch/type III secretory pathway protein FliN
LASRRGTVRDASTRVTTGAQTRVRAFDQLARLSPALSQCWQTLWEKPDLRLDLWAIDNQPLYWARQDRYLQTPDTLVLMPETLGSRLLGLTLGNSQRPGLTALEHDILHHACQTLSQQAKLPVGQSPAMLSAPSWSTYWLASTAEGFLGQLCIVWPKKLAQQLPWPDPPAVPDPLPWLEGVMVQAKIHAGQTRLPLNSLPLLEPGDLLVLDNSQRDTLMIHTPEGYLRFATTMSQHLPQYPALSDPGGADPTPPDWNHLMVELTAEFEPFQLPLGEVRAMSEGLLVELDDLAHNQLTIHSQGTRIAQGRLVVVGDRFAVRIDKVMGQQAGPGQSDKPVSQPDHTEAEDDELDEFAPPGQPDHADEPTFDDDEEEQEQW